MRKLITLLLCVVMAAASISSGTAQISEAAAVSKTPVFSNASTVSSAPAIDGAAVDSSTASKKILPGEPYPGQISSGNPSDKALEAAIKAVKAKITIPKEYSEFNFYFNGTSSYADSYWTLNWRNPADSSYIQVNCDQDNHIIFYSTYNYTNKMGGVPVYLKKELKETADNFIKQIDPEVFPKLEFVSAEYENVYSGAYAYTYQRKENGISFPDNSVVVWVDSITGSVRSASVHWLFDVAVPSADIKFTKEQAADIIKKNMKMNLVYRTNYYRIYDSISNGYSQKAFLVYEPDPGYVSVDAKTGKVYLTRNEWVVRDSNSGAAADESTAMAKEADGSVSLTEEEIAKIEELEKLISKDKAIDLVTKNKYLYIDKSLISYTANLNKYYNNNGQQGTKYVWNIELKDARPIDYNKDTDLYRAYASATVDAKTGKILSFYASIKSNYDEKNNKWNTVKIKYSKDQCQKTLETFLKSQIMSRFNKSKLVNKTEDYVAYYKVDNIPVYGGYSYHYNRFNEGIEYSYNGISGSVDGVTGKIYSYSSNWDDNVEFESPKGAMTADQALAKYLSNEGYHLVYEVNEINTYDPNYKGEDKYYDSSKAYSLTQEIRLVYRPDVNPPNLSPFTGEQLNYDGTAVTKAVPYTYSDITDTAENREILLLADMNVGFEGGLFNPGKEITVGELSTLMEKVGYGWYNEENDKTSTKLITREEMALNFVKRLGLGKMAAMKDIYKTGYYDENNIGPDYVGAVALAKGLGLMDAKANGMFQPKDNVTRAEAVHLIMNYINAQKQGIN